MFAASDRIEAEAVKEQYVGDVNDYRKYALLRALTRGTDLRLGVAWMLTPDDGGNDGRRLGYLAQPKFRLFDPELFDILATIAQADKGQRLNAIEQSGALPRARYANALVPDGLLARRTYMSDLRAAFFDRDLVFFDPDNGLDVPSKGKGAKGSSKYVYRDEIEGMARDGKSVIAYQHFPMEKREPFVHRLAAELQTMCRPASVWAFVTAHVVFLLVVHPGHALVLDQQAAQVGAKWPAEFITALKIA